MSENVSDQQGIYGQHSLSTEEIHSHVLVPVQPGVFVYLVEFFCHVFTTKNHAAKVAERKRWVILWHSSGLPVGVGDFEVGVDED